MGKGQITSNPEIMMGKPMVVLLGIAFVTVAVPIFSQTQAVPRPSFEVASIKAADPNTRGLVEIRQQPGGRVSIKGVTLKRLIGYAYRMRDSQVIGGPEWINTDVYEIQAKAEDGSIPVQTGPPDLTVPDAYAFRTQSLIDERFQMKMHRETREFPVYELVVARGGPKWLLSDDQSIPKMPDPSTPPAAPPRPGTFPARGGISMGRNASGSTLHAVGAPLSNILSVLSQIMGRPIVDKTELKAGLYDINLQYVDSGPIAGGPVGPEPSVTAGDPVGASIFTAVQEQLGLRLVSSKGPLEVLVIDSVQKPTPN